MWNTRESQWRSRRTTNCWTYWDRETQCHLFDRMGHGLFKVTNKLVLCVLLEGWRLINQCLKWQRFNLPALVYFPRSLKLWPTEAKAIRFFSKLCLVPVTVRCLEEHFMNKPHRFCHFFRECGSLFLSKTVIQHFLALSWTQSLKKISTSTCSLPMWFSLRTFGLTIHTLSGST